MIVNDGLLMGVPSFFAWWARHYPHQILYKALPYKDVVLYLDFNGGIHPAVRTDKTLKYEDMFEAVSAYLDKIVNYVKPKEVWIAIDGVAPVAKLSQQRERRFKSAKESKHKHEIALEHGESVRSEHVDFNMISPGTDFMYDLEDHLVEYIEKMTEPGQKWERMKFSLSGSSAPGEGEHKIMSEIRARKSRGINEHNCIYGLDADLVFLSLENTPDCFLVRENVQFRNREELGFDPATYPYIYLDMRELRDKVCDLLDPICTLNDLSKMNFKYDFKLIEPHKGPMPSNFYNPETDQQRLVRDYIFICFLMGNDFLPRLPCLKIRNGSLSNIVVIYKKVAWRLSSYIVNPDLTINRTFFYQLIKEIASLEDDFMLQMTDQRVKDISRFRFRLRDKTPYEQAIEEFDYVENQYYDTIQGGTDNWRKRYYEYHLNIVYRHEKEHKRHINPICEEYLRGMSWILQYYTGHHDNWSWFYPYDTSPTAKDLLEALPHIDVDYKFENNTPVDPYVQLLSILPPDSAHLLPSTLRPLMTDRDSPIHFMYPLKITLTMIGNKFWHECKPRMPLVNHELLNNVVDAKKRYLSERELDRNTIKSVRIF